MKITAFKKQVKNQNRVNIYVDGKYSFSLDTHQLLELKLSRYQDLSDELLEKLKQESDFGKIYTRCVEYCIVRPRSEKEIRDYLYRKKVQSDLSERIIKRLGDNKLLNDLRFAEFWLETRRQKKGASKLRLTSELKAKGVNSSIIEQAMGSSNRNEIDDLDKVIVKKRSKYDDKKLITYLAGQGFRYQDIVSRIRHYSENSDISA